MGAYPTYPRAEFLEWCTLHEGIFSDHAAELGLTAEQADGFKTATGKSQAGLQRQKAAKSESKAATEHVGVAFDELGRAAGNVVRTIRAFAETTDDPAAVYDLAKIPAPSAPSPMPPPGQPTNLTVVLDPTFGTMTLRWQCKNPAGASGTSYIIRRRLPGEEAFTFIGVAGKKSFVDTSLVAGPDSVQYVVQGQRAEQVGPASPLFTVNFGRLPNGGRTASVTANATTVAQNSADPARWNVNIPAPAGNGRSVQTGI